MQEILWRVLSFPLRVTSRSTVFVNVDPPSKRKVNVPRAMLQDSEALEQLLHRSAEGHITHKSHNKYAMRPVEQESITMFSFLRGDDAEQVGAEPEVHDGEDPLAYRRSPILPSSFSSGWVIGVGVVY